MKKKVTICKLKMSLNRNLLCLRLLLTFWVSVKCIFTILLQIQHGNNFLPTIKHWRAKVCHFLGICLYDFFVYHSNFVYQKCLKTRHHLGCSRKTVNSPGYSELWEPSKCALICALFTGLVNTKTKYGRICGLNDLLLSLRDHLLKPQ